MEKSAGRWLQAGRVGRPHGLDGSFHVREATVALLAPGVEVVVDGHQSRIVRRAGDDRHPIVRLAGYETRSAAQSLAGRALLVEQSEAPELEPDEWWAEDLVGCLVHDAGQEVGTVVRLLALPSCEVLEVSRPGGAEELLVPLVSDAVRTVDIDQQRIDIDLEFLGAS
jgi:16S rRNA processing protein RimM